MKKSLKKFLAGILSIGVIGTMTATVDAAAKIPADASINSTSTIQVEKLNLEKSWDKVFPQSNKVNHQKVTFVNRYGITLAADMYTPKNYTRANFPRLQSADHLAQSRNNQAACTRRKWLNAVF